jgi:WD40 repeat protein
LGELLPWSVRFAVGRQAVFHAMQRLHSQGLVTLATGLVDGRPVIVTSDLDYKVQVWDGLDGHFMRAWNAHRGVTRAMAVDMSGETSYLVTGGTDMSLAVWELATGELLRRIAAPSPVTCLALDSTDDGTVITAGSRDGMLRTWHLGSWEQIEEFQAHDDAVSAVTYGSVGGVRVIGSGGLDRNVQVWGPGRPASAE